MTEADILNSCMSSESLYESIMSIPRSSTERCPLTLIKKSNKVDYKTHIYRNKNQSKMCPPTLEGLRLLEEMELLRCTPFLTPTHNLIQADDTVDGRWIMFRRIVPENKLVTRNLDFRGAIDTPYEHCQFIWDDINHKVVYNNLNRGSYDFYSPYRSLIDHFCHDVAPWILWSNGDNNETLEDTVMPRAKWSKIQDLYKSWKKLKVDLHETHVSLTNVIHN